MLTVAGIPLSIAVHQFGDWLKSALLFLPFAVVGLLIVRRQPRNPVGWIMLALNGIYTLGVTAGAYAVLAYRFDHPDLPLARLAVALTQCWLALVLLLPVPILLYPDGRLPIGRWRWTVWIYAAASLALLSGTAVTDLTAFTVRTVHVDSSGELQSLSGSQDSLSAKVGAFLFLVWLILALSWVVRQVLAFRSSTGVRREQLKWLVTGAVIGIVGFSMSLAFHGGSNPVLRALSFGFVGIAAVPLSIGVGILRYRLYEIDRLVSRTLSYTILTGLLIGFYLGLIALATRVLPLSSPVAVAGSTLAAAALFNPLRRRIQRVVDYRFNRSRYDAEATIAAYALSLREAVSFDHLQDELIAVVARAVAPGQVGVWINSP